MTAHLGLHLSHTKKHDDCHDGRKEVSCEANHVENQDNVIQRRRRRIHIGLTNLLANVTVQEDETTSREVLFGLLYFKETLYVGLTLRHSHLVLNLSTPSSLR